MDEIITLGDSSSDEDDIEIVEEKHPLCLDARKKMAKEGLEEMVKKRLEEVVMTKLQRQNMELLPKGRNFKINLISRKTGKPVTFDMVDLDRINNCSVSRIIQHNGVELEKDWISPNTQVRTILSDLQQKEFSLPKSVDRNESSKKCLSVESLKIPSQNVDVVTLDEVTESLPVGDEHDLLMDLDLGMDSDIDPDICHALPLSPMEPDELSPGFHLAAFAFISSLPHDSWTDVERTEWTGSQRRGVEDEIFGGQVRTPGWGVLHPDTVTMTRTGRLEEENRDLQNSLASLERLRSSTDRWSCGCKVTQRNLC